MKVLGKVWDRFFLDAAGKESNKFFEKFKIFLDTKNN